MIEITKPKFDPIALPGSSGYTAGGPRIGDPVPAPKSAAGPVLANNPESASSVPPGPAPAPAWVREAIGKLFVPSRAKAAVLVAGAALGAGMYAAKVFTAGTPEPPAATAVLDVAKPEPQTPTPNNNTSPLLLTSGITTPSPNSTTLTSTPPAGNIPVIATPTMAEQFRGREVSTVIPSVELTRSSSPTVPELTFPNLPSTNPAANPGGTNSGSVAVPNINVGAIQPVDGVSSATTGNGTGVGGGTLVVPAIPGTTTTTPPAATVPNLTNPTTEMSVPKLTTPPTTLTVPNLTAPAAPPSTVPSLDVPKLGGIGGGATGPVTPVVPVTPTTTHAPANPSPPASHLPDLTGTGTGGGSIGAGAANPGPLPSLAPPSPVVGVETARHAPIPAPTAPKQPETSFDEDVHTVRQGDSYASISKDYYGDAAFAGALQRYEESRAGRTAGTVHVPPVWVLRKRYPQAIRGEAPVPPAATVPAATTSPVSTSGGTDWNAARGNTRGKTYALPRAMTMREIAKEAFGDDAYWNRVWDLNLNLSTDAVLPQGTKINLPPDAKVGQ